MKRVGIRLAGRVFYPKHRRKTQYRHASGSVDIQLAKRFFEENPRMQGKKHSKIGHLAGIFDAAGADFDPKTPPQG